MILFVSPDSTRISKISRELGADASIHQLDDPEPQSNEIIRYVDNHGVDTVVLGPGLDRETTEGLIVEITELFPYVGVLAFIEKGASAMRSAFRLGATDVASSVASGAEIAQTIEHVQQRIDRRRHQGGAIAADPGPQRRVMTVVSSRGGVGRTLVAAGIASALERLTPGEVVLVDLDLQAGDIGSMLGLTSHLSIASLVGREAEMDSSDVKAVLTTDADGLHVLPAPESLTASVEVTAELVTALLKLLAASFRYVVIDTGPYLSECTLAAIDSSSDLLMVCAPDVPSVRAVGRTNDSLDQLSVIAPRRHLVINRATDRYGMSARDIESVTGMASAVQIRASKEIAIAMNHGTSFHQLLQQRSVVHKAMSELVDGVAPDLGPPSRRRLLRLLA